MLMTPALGFFYGVGAAQERAGHHHAQLFHSGAHQCAVGVDGYTLAFGTDVKGWGIIGGFDGWACTRDGGAERILCDDDPAGGRSSSIRRCFAIITPSLITGAFAERIRFKAFVLFSLLWATLVYDPIAHWVWGKGGWLGGLGALDFAGGTVVHISSGISALVAAAVLGKRLLGKDAPLPNDAPMVVLGAGLLWFGWFGFNAGSALAADGLAVQAFINTNTAAAMAALTWMTISWAVEKRPKVMGAAAGAVAGLVAITPAAGYVTVAASLLIGLGAGALCFTAVRIKNKKLGIDDALDVFPVHGVGGIWGALAVGLFATVSVNPLGADGLFYGNAGLILKQLLAIAATGGYAAIVTWLILKVLDKTVGLRVAEHEEKLGLDVTQHGEPAYAEQ
jgi:Amt family ammonium transporter